MQTTLQNAAYDKAQFDTDAFNEFDTLFNVDLIDIKCAQIVSRVHDLSDNDALNYLSHLRMTRHATFMRRVYSALEN